MTLCRMLRAAFRPETIIGLAAVVACGNDTPRTDGNAVHAHVSVTNLTGVEATAIYLSPSSSASWEENVLGRGRLSDGSTVTIALPDHDLVSSWDVRMEARVGAAEWKALPLGRIAAITLRNGEKGIVALLDSATFAVKSP